MAEIINDDERAKKKKLPTIGDNRFWVILVAIIALTVIACYHMYLTSEGDGKDKDFGYAGIVAMSLIAACAGVDRIIPGMGKPKNISS